MSDEAQEIALAVESNRQALAVLSRAAETTHALSAEQTSSIRLLGKTKPTLDRDRLASATEELKNVLADLPGVRQ